MAVTTPSTTPPVSAPAPGGSAQPPDRSGRRAPSRMLLSTFYAVDEADKAALGGQTDDTASLNSASFNAETYFQNLLKTLSLSGLMAKDKELLDGVFVLFCL